jgi:GNAT superfamily N-acetyltransferase
MATSFIELSPQDPWPEAEAPAGVAPVPETDRRLHAPDVSLGLHDNGRLLARASCWWRGTPVHEGMATGVIGHYAAADAGAGGALLRRACELIAAAGAAVAIGPMDGNTWRRYRFIVERGDEPVFLLEPDNPDEWPAQWTNAGFSPLATYTSAINDDLSVEDPRTDQRLARLEGEGVRIRTIDAARIDLELPRIHALSLRAFAHNFLYTPLGEREFAAQYHAVLPLVRPELVLLAERGDDLIGFMFAIPDALQARRGHPVDTVILKTIAVDPSVAGSGLGGAMLDLAQRAARRLGFRRAIHALIHETNTSKQISDRYARTIRRYALYARLLTP